MSEELKDGEVVYLKSAPDVMMTVRSVYNDGRVECIWLNKRYEVQIFCFWPYELAKVQVI